MLFLHQSIAHLSLPDCESQSASRTALKHVDLVELRGSEAKRSWRLLPPGALHSAAATKINHRMKTRGIDLNNCFKLL